MAADPGRMIDVNGVSLYVEEDEMRQARRGQPQQLADRSAPVDSPAVIKSVMAYPRRQLGV